MLDGVTSREYFILSVASGAAPSSMVPSSSHVPHAALAPYDQDHQNPT